jgi:hypothetical protein
MVPVIESRHIYQPLSIMAPTGMKMGFKVTSEFVPKVDVYKAILYFLSGRSSLWIMSEDFMVVYA